MYMRWSVKECFVDCKKYSLSGSKIVFVLFLQYERPIDTSDLVVLRSSIFWTLVLIEISSTSYFGFEPSSSAMAPALLSLFKLFVCRKSSIYHILKLRLSPLFLLQWMTLLLVLSWLLPNFLLSFLLLQHLTTTLSAFPSRSLLCHRIREEELKKSSSYESIWSTNSQAYRIFGTPPHYFK